jgi:hypothetical protein
LFGPNRKKKIYFSVFTHLLTEYKVNGKESMKLKAIDLPINVKTLSGRTFKDRLHLKQPWGCESFYYFTCNFSALVYFGNSFLALLWDAFFNK